jgi:putative transposase
MTKRQGKSGTIDVKALLRADEEFLRALVRTALQEVLEAERTEALGAEKGERTAERQGYRSGYYGRTLITRIGKLELRVPQDRAGRFSTELFERYPALGASAGGGAGGDVCARGIDAELCGHSFSASSISAINQRLDDGLAQIRRSSVGRSRSLPDCRRALRTGARGRGDRQPGGADRDRHRLGRPPPGDGGRARQPRKPIELAGFPAGAEGARSARRRVHRRRRSRRPQGGITRGSGGGGLSTLLRAFSANALDHVPRRVDDDCLQELRWLYDRRDLIEARRDLAAWLTKWSSKYSKLTGWVEDNIDETLTFYRLPRQHHKHLKSTNMLERLTEQIKRRTHVVRIFPNRDSGLRLVRALAVETHENWLEQHRYLNMDDLREHKKKALRRAA